MFMFIWACPLCVVFVGRSDLRYFRVEERDRCRTVRRKKRKLRANPNILSEQNINLKYEVCLCLSARVFLPRKP